MIKYFLFFFILISCSNSEDNPKAEFSGRELWDFLKIENYSMIQTMSCYCFPEEITYPKKIIVKNKKIQTIDGEIINKFDWHSSFKTVD